MKTALITGITGQDGSYLSELLLERGYTVHGITRQNGGLGASRIEHLLQNPAMAGRIHLHRADLRDAATVIQVLKAINPNEVYNLGAQSQVHTSFESAEFTTDVNATGTIRLLDAMLKTGSQAHYYQASSSEMFGRALSSPQNEETPFRPRNPYACAKVFSHWAVVNYRESKGLHASNGICFNHESPRRAEIFVSRKITRALARILAGKQKILSLGNLDAVRDWGFAKDYVEAMWMMVQAPQGDDYVIATGKTRSIRDFLDEAFGLASIRWQDHVRIDPQHFRPAEDVPLVGDITKIRAKLGWSPRTDFSSWVRLMVEDDLRLEGLDPANHIRTMERAA